MRKPYSRNTAKNSDMRKLTYKRNKARTLYFLQVPKNVVSKSKANRAIFKLPYAIVGYKVVRNKRGDPEIIKLLIPENTPIHGPMTSATPRKPRNLFDLSCLKFRASKAHVLGNTTTTTVWYSNYTSDFVYTKGHKVSVRNFSRKLETCAPGIHFFLTIDEAVVWAGYTTRDSYLFSHVRGF